MHYCRMEAPKSTNLRSLAAGGHACKSIVTVCLGGLYQNSLRSGTAIDSTGTQCGEQRLVLRRLTQ